MAATADPPAAALAWLNDSGQPMTYAAVITSRGWIAVLYVLYVFLNLKIAYRLAASPSSVSRYN
jgi:hypothetical protein